MTHILYYMLLGHITSKTHISDFDSLGPTHTFLEHPTLLTPLYIMLIMQHAPLLVILIHAHLYW
jgi:hypothetical protein